MARPLRNGYQMMDSGLHQLEENLLSEYEVEGLASKVRAKAQAILATRDDLSSPEDIRQVYITISQQELREHLQNNSHSDADAADQDIAIADIVDYATGLRIVNKVRKLGQAGAVDVFCKGTSCVVVHYRDGKREVIDPWFDDVREMGNVLLNLRMALGQHSTPFDMHHPFFNARLPEGIRVNASHCSNNHYGVSFCIPNRSITSLDALVRNGTISQSLRSFLEGAVHARLNVIIAGGTGAGKTALMLCMLAHLQSNERVVTIEDSAELDLATVHPHLDVVELEAIGANSDGLGEVTTRELLKNSLRMHPDRIIVGEARDEIARELLQAMVTGNEGSMSTLHARSNETIVDRLVECAALPVDRVSDSIRNAVDLFIHIDKFGTERRITRISQVSQMREADGLVRLLPIFDGGGRPTDDTFSQPDYLNRPVGDVLEKLRSVGWEA